VQKGVDRTHTWPSGPQLWRQSRIRLYVSGTITDQISFMFNTEYKGSPPAGQIVAVNHKQYGIGVQLQL
jgi:hypothetical protein